MFAGQARAFLVGFLALQLYWGWLHGRSFLKAQAKAKAAKAS